MNGFRFNDQYLSIELKKGKDRFVREIQVQILTRFE